MRAHGHTWDSHVIFGKSTGGWMWLQWLRQRLSACRAAHQQALLTSQAAGWDARRERVGTFTAVSSLEHAAAQAGPSMAMALYTAHTDMACTG
jgi:hypothetical protein